MLVWQPGASSKLPGSPGRTPPRSPKPTQAVTSPPSFDASTPLAYKVSGDELCPAGFLCPICSELFSDPVITVDGNSYCRSCIVEWFGIYDRQKEQPWRGAGERQPLPLLAPATRQPLACRALLQNTALAASAKAFREVREGWQLQLQQREQERLQLLRRLDSLEAELRERRRLEEKVEGGLCADMELLVQELERKDGLATAQQAILERQGSELRWAFKEADAFQAELQESCSESALLKVACSQSREEAKALLSECRSLEECGAASHQRQLAAFQHGSELKSEVQQRAEEVADLEEELAQAEQLYCAEMRFTEDECSQIVSHLQGKLDMTASELSRSCEAAELLQEELDSGRRQVSALEADKAVLQAAASEKEGVLHGRVSALQMELDSNQAFLQKQEQQVSTLAARLQLEMAEAAALKARGCELEEQASQEVAALECRLACLLQEQDDFISFREEAHQASTQLQASENVANVRLAELQRTAEKQLQLLETRDIELLEERAQRSGLAAKLEVVEKEASLRTAELHSAQSWREATRNEVERLRHAAFVQETELCSALAEGEATRGELHEMQHCFRQGQELEVAESKAAQGKVERLQEETRRHEELVLEVRCRAASEVAERDAARAEVAKLQQELGSELEKKQMQVDHAVERDAARAEVLKLQQELGAELEKKQLTNVAQAKLKQELASEQERSQLSNAEHAAERDAARSETARLERQLGTEISATQSLQAQHEKAEAKVELLQQELKAAREAELFSRRNSTTAVKPELKHETIRKACELQDQQDDALRAVCKAGVREAVLPLVAAGAEVNRADADGVTALLIASIEGHAEVVQELVLARADVNAQDIQGWTPLYVASLTGRGAVVKALLAAGADQELVARDGTTVLEVARRRSSHSLEEFAWQELDHFLPVIDDPG